ncbi:hypothetical protein G9A89_019161 [Geosiphon pyriformis]|nr:hypothetical protein G9A89_019161 [Geosiphon pyriformis]
MKSDLLSLLHNTLGPIKQLNHELKRKTNCSIEMVKIIQECITCRELRFVFPKISASCVHFDICEICIRRQIEIEVNSKGEVIKITCPKYRCNSVLSYDDVKRLASVKIFERYDNLLLRIAISKLEDFRWCKNPECGSGQEHSSGDEQPIMTCHACGAKSCFTHDVPWHEGLKCDEFSEKIETEQKPANQAYYDRYTKKCPDCEMAIEKNHGCDHMKCRCGHEFCWLCLAEYEPIRNHDFGKNILNSNKRLCQLGIRPAKDYKERRPV